MALTKNDEAVSPVIGVILMVAVTVILAAVIASFVFGSAQNIQKTRVVAATAQTTTTGDIYFTYHGGPDTDSLTAITIIAPDGSEWYTTSTDGALMDKSTGTAPSVPPGVGAVMKLTQTALWPPTGQRHVVVVATFNDGTVQVILDTIQ